MQVKYKDDMKIGVFVIKEFPATWFGGYSIELPWIVINKKLISK